MRELIKIFDATLRDGEQSPGATMNVAEKVRPISMHLTRWSLKSRSWLGCNGHPNSSDDWYGIPTSCIKGLIEHLGRMGCLGSLKPWSSVP